MGTAQSSIPDDVQHEISRNGGSHATKMWRGGDTTGASSYSKEDVLRQMRSEAWEYSLHAMWCIKKAQSKVDTLEAEMVKMVKMEEEKDPNMLSTQEFGNALYTVASEGVEGIMDALFEELYHHHGGAMMENIRKRVKNKKISARKDKGGFSNAHYPEYNSHEVWGDLQDLYEVMILGPLKEVEKATALAGGD